jgi:Zn finger protein HypA/HybF involved in hydrogenase expression
MIVITIIIINNTYVSACFDVVSQGTFSDACSLKLVRTEADKRGSACWQGHEMFLTSKSSRLTVGLTHLLIQWVLGFFPRGQAARV